MSIGDVLFDKSSSGLNSDYHGLGVFIFQMNALHFDLGSHHRHTTSNHPTSMTSVGIPESLQTLNNDPTLSLLFILDVKISAGGADREKGHASSCNAGVEPRPCKES